MNYGFTTAFNFTFDATATGLADVNESPTASAGVPPRVDGHVDPRQIMDVGVMNGNIPAPLMAIDEDDEFFLTLTNVGMIMRPDLFEQHTVHFHGYPNASVVLRRRAGCLGRDQHRRAASPTTTSRPMPARTSGTATSPRPSTCRWAWSGRSTCARGRTACR